MFNERFYQKKLGGEPNIRKDLFYRNLIELEFINKYLGGHSISINGLKKIATDKSNFTALWKLDAEDVIHLKQLQNGLKNKIVKSIYMY